MGNDFLLGGDYYRVSDQLTLSDGSGFFRLEVTSVRKDEIQFRDLKSNELLKLNLNQAAPQLPKVNGIPGIPSNAENKVIEL